MDDVGKRRRKKKPQGPRSAFRQEVLNLPNSLTMGRVVLIPFVMIAMAQSDDLVVGGWQARHAAFWATLMFAVASVTDFLDGWLARNLNLQSMFGRFLDPLADKLLVMACLIELVALDRAPTWLVVLLLSREVGITGLRAIAAEEGFELPSDRWGKWKTAVQMTGLIGLLLHFPIESEFILFRGVVDYHRVGLILLAISMIFSVVSALSYLLKFLQTAFQLHGRRTETVPAP